MIPYSHYHAKRSSLVGIPASPAPAPASTATQIDRTPGVIGDLSFATMTPQQFAAQEQLRMLAGGLPEPSPAARSSNGPGSLLSRSLAPFPTTSSLIDPATQASMLAASTTAMANPGLALFPNDPVAAQEFSDRQKALGEASLAKPKDPDNKKPEDSQSSDYFATIKQLIANNPRAAQLALYGGGGALAGGALAALLSSKKNRMRNMLIGSLLGGGLGALGRAGAYQAFGWQPDGFNANKGYFEDAWGRPRAPSTWAEGMGAASQHGPF